MNPHNRIRLFIDIKTWFKDERIRHLSLDDRAIWLDILILMLHEEPCYRLTVQGRPMTTLECRLCLNIPAKEFRRSIAAIKQAGLLSISNDGCLVTHCLPLRKEAFEYE